MGQTFSKNLTGANCQLGGQAIISLSVSEDVEADYATASATCLAPSGPHSKGAVVTSVEGGVSTGQWEVDDPVRLRSGDRTWRRRAGEGHYRHLPLVHYKLRRRGYNRCRSTLSASNIGQDHFPPKFCTLGRFAEITNELLAKRLAGEIHSAELERIRRSWHPVYNAGDIISTMCSWVGQPVAFWCSLSGPCAPEYQPIGKPLIAACKEVAAWSGASLYLDRTGTLIVYDFAHQYGRAGGGVPMPRAVLAEELHDGLYGTNVVTVVGWGYTGPYVYPSSLFATRERKTAAVEWSEGLSRAQGERAVEERIEIREYPITPTLAQKIARERLTRIALSAGAGSWRGPAEGSESYSPLTHRVFAVDRTLEWDGSKYKYEIELTGPRSSLSWGGSVSSEGWWW